MLPAERDGHFLEEELVVITFQNKRKTNRQTDKQTKGWRGGVQISVLTNSCFGDS